AARLFYFTVWARPEYLRSVERLSGRSGVIPSLRGRLLSVDGHVLAWSVIRTDICLKSIPASDQARALLQRRIREFAPEFLLSSAVEGVILIKELSPEKEMRLFPLVSTTSELLFVKRVSRETRKDGDWTFVGAVEWRDGRFVGINGYEKEYDERLRGRDGKYQVMVDRRGRWIPGTWKEIAKTSNGEDVVVP
ncbi:MAG: hypothetical protein KAG97_11590, partial [Victivallales bacterium]|nr:hypothetical protein [Victivallales bacterium]